MQELDRQRAGAMERLAAVNAKNAELGQVQRNLTDAEAMIADLREQLAQTRGYQNKGDQTPPPPMPTSKPANRSAHSIQGLVPGQGLPGPAWTTAMIREWAKSQGLPDMPNGHRATKKQTLEWALAANSAMEQAREEAAAQFTEVLAQQPVKPPVPTTDEPAEQE